jgi:alkanesulfonate monooxygenase SsuD/methylene tetrahydromethanopterin reductase-like flavin-dependent oxidoreductase (luciferase family)
VLYVYAIVDPGTEADVSGLRGADVRSVRAGAVDVLVSEHDRIEPSADVDEVWAHENVVESAAESGAVLPLRFGSVVADEAAVQSLVEERAQEFTRALDRVRGAVEIGVRAAVSTDETPEPVASPAERPGTAYLMTRLAQKQRGDEIIDLVHRPLAGMAREHVRLDRSIGDPSSVRLAYLVDEDAVEPFQERVQDLDSELEQVRLACTGPWPPYSFAGGGIE